VYPVVIDAHPHLWNTERLHYVWLQRPENAAINPLVRAPRLTGRP
jgi:predicted TIM-barrel fold metal-dependent hydrolase